MESWLTTNSALDPNESYHAYYEILWLILTWQIATAQHWYKIAIWKSETVKDAQYQLNVPNKT